MAESTNTDALHQGFERAEETEAALALALRWNSEAPFWAETHTAPRAAQKSRTLLSSDPGFCWEVKFLDTQFKFYHPHLLSRIQWIILFNLVTVISHSYSEQ